MADWGAKLDDTEVRKRLTFMGSGAPLKAGLLAAAVYFKGKASVYPPVRRQRMQFTSVRQQRAFFAKLKAGEIVVPYPRGTAPTSETASKRWANEARDDGLTQVVGNNASYAKYLYSPAAQAAYHKGNWKTVEEMVKAEGAETRKVLYNATVQSIRNGK